MWKTITDVCKQHNTRTYFEDKDGVIGVYNHRNVIMWYYLIPGVGYSLQGESPTPQGAQEKKIAPK